jgi:glycosyltransferase involved in cell wall biosynthesis
MHVKLAVSVIIPAYNAEKFIHVTLDSVRVQTFKDYEIIVVDDGSQDQTKAVVDDYFNYHGMRGCCIRQKNKGIAGARNTGIAHASGEYIALLDHDDTWYPLKLQKTMEEFQRHPQTGLVCHHLMMIKNDKEIGIWKAGPASRNMYEKLLFTSRGNDLSPSAAVFRKDKAIEIEGFRENPEFNTAEDYDFWLRMSRIAEFRFIDETLGSYLIIDSGASKKILYHHRNVEAVLKDHFDSYVSSHPGFIMRVRMRRRMAILYRTAVHNLLKQKTNPDMQREYLIRMLKTYPFNLKNIIVAILWVLKRRA